MPSNEFFDSSGAPATRSAGSSAAIRAEFDAVEQGFNKLPALATKGDLPVFINSGGTAMEAITAASARTKLGVPSLGAAQNQAANWIGAAAGTVDVITCGATPAITAYAEGQTFRFVSSGENTTNVTINIDAVGAKAITKNGTTALAAGDIPSGAVVEIIYDGTGFQIVGVVADRAKSADLASGNGTSLVGTADADTGSVPRTLFSILSEKKRVTSLRHASDPDWTLAFQRAAASGAKHIVVAGDEYDIDAATAVTMASGQFWDFDGAVINFPTVNGVLFYANNIDDWGIHGQVLVLGAGKSAATGAALHILGANRFRVEGFGAKNIAGWGIKHDPGTPSGTSRGDQGQFIAPQLHGCYRGFENTADTGAEYSTMLAPMISGCDVGAKVAAGNTTIIGGDIVDNVDGLIVMNGSNHAHGIISAVNLNHNSQYAIHANQVVNGQTLADCHIYGNGASAGAVFLDRCKGVTFDGGILDAWIYNYSGVGSGYNYIRNMNCPGSYGAIERNDSGALVPAELIIMGCYGDGAYKSGVSINDPAPVYVHATRATAQALSGTTTLIFPIVADNGDRRRAYDETTGIFTVPAGQAGQYKITANILCGVTAIVAGNNFVEVLVNDAAPRLFMPSTYSTTLLSFVVDLELHLTAGDTIKIKATIDGSSPTFGSSTYMSGMSIKRIA